MMPAQRGKVMRARGPFRLAVAASVIAMTASGALYQGAHAQVGHASEAAASTIQPRISKYSIQLSPRILKAGQRLTIKVSGIFQSKSCAVTLIQGRQQSRATLAVRNYSAAGRIIVPRNFKGSTVARVACGKDGTATSDPVMVVGPNEPTTATCTVVEHGFGHNGEDYAYAGVVVRNSAPSLSADGVEIALTYRDASGRVVKTDTIWHSDGIAPATTIILAGTTQVDSRAVTLTVASRCRTSTKDVPRPIPSSASIVTERFSTTVQGEFRNTASRTMSSSCKVAYLVRNAGGAIIGADTAYTDSFVPSGGIGTWDDYVSSRLPYSVADSIEANVFPRFD